MKTLLPFLILLTSCVPDKTFYVWEKDLVGHYIFGGLTGFFVLLFIWLWIDEKVRKKKKW